MLRTQTGLDKTPCIDRTLAVHDQFVDDDEEDQRHDGHRERDTEAQDDDDRIGDEIPDHGEEPHDERDGEHRFG